MTSATQYLARLARPPKVPLPVRELRLLEAIDYRGRGGHDQHERRAVAASEDGARRPVRGDDPLEFFALAAGQAESPARTSISTLVPDAATLP